MMNHRGHRERHANGFSRALRFLRVLCGKSILPLLAVQILFASHDARAQDKPRANQLRYDLKLAINFDDRTYTGTEQVHWVNHGDHATSTIFFHLYPNMRPPDYVTP